jgi:hypothetical protein
VRRLAIKTQQVGVRDRVALVDAVRQDRDGRAGHAPSSN